MSAHEAARAATRRPRAVFAVLAPLLAAACANQPRNDVLAAPDSGQHPVLHATIVYTSDEHGWVLPNEIDTRRWGGASPFLAELQSLGHCLLDGQRDVAFVPGAWKPPARPDEGLAFEVTAPLDVACHRASDASFLLSGGDNYTGPAVSGYFHGETMAATIARLGYDASAFGNHEFDFGRDQFSRNRTIGGLRYLAANMHLESGAATPWAEPYTVVERGGVRLGIVGLATHTTPKVALARNFVGVRFEDEESALERTVPELWKRGVDAVVLIAHVCHDDLAPIVERHPEWHLSFAGSGHCHREQVEVRAGVPVLAVGWRLEHYGRVELEIDPSVPEPTARARTVSWELREVTSALDAPEPRVDPAFAERLAAFQKEVDDELGSVVGYTTTGLPKTGAALGQWLTRSWREAFSADVAITTRGALRQDLPAGPIRLGTVLSIMPFENELVVCKVAGADLETMLREPKALVSGLRCQAGHCTEEDGSPIDASRIYRVVTTDFLFYGGDGFRFSELDGGPVLTGVGWREPVIAWTRAHAADVNRPLETALGGE